MFYLLGCPCCHNQIKENTQVVLKVLTNVLIIAAIRVWVSGSVPSIVKLTVIKKTKHWNRIHFPHTLRCQDNWKFTEFQRRDWARLNERKLDVGGDRRGWTNRLLRSDLLLCLLFINVPTFTHSCSQIHLSPEGPGLVAGPGSDAHLQSAMPGSTQASVTPSTVWVSGKITINQVHVLFMCGEVSFGGTSATHKCCHVNMSKMGASKVMQLKNEVSSLSLCAFLPAGLWCLSVLWLCLVIYCPHTCRSALTMLCFLPPTLSLCTWVCVLYTYTQ